MERRLYSQQQGTRQAHDKKMKQVIYPVDLIPLTFHCTFLYEITVYNYVPEVVNVMVARQSALSPFHPPILKLIVASGEIDLPCSLQWTATPENEIIVRPQDLVFRTEPTLSLVQTFIPSHDETLYYNTTLEIHEYSYLSERNKNV